MKKKIAAALLALIMALGCVPALGENIKHERVFAVTAADGTVLNLTDSVRLENKDQAAELADRTRLTGIENVGGNQAFTLSGETLTWQADGADILYQGTSDQAPALLPLVSLTLDGEEIALSDLKDKTGEAVLTVTYRSASLLPILAVTALPLPQTGVTNLTLTNAALISEMGRQVVIGWGMPGADAALTLPDSFTAAFHADHADLSWMMTLASADPVDIACDRLAARVDLDAEALLEEIIQALTAMKEGKSLPVSFDKLGSAAMMVNQLNSSLTQLNDGAKDLNDGAKKLKNGAADLKTGAAKVNGGAEKLSDGAQTLSDSLTATVQGAKSVTEGLQALDGQGEALNAGAEQVFTALLASAQAQLAAADANAPALTAENYGAVLEDLIARTPAEAAQPLTALKAQLDQASAFVAGVKAYTDGAAQAAQGAAQLSGGMDSLTEGAANLSDGAAELAAGTQSLADGAADLSDGAATLSKGAFSLYFTGTQPMKTLLTTAEKQAAEKLLPIAKEQAADVLRMFNEIRSQAGTGGYDLRPEGMKTVTVYIIRTDL